MGKASRLESIYYRNEMLREDKHLTKVDFQYIIFNNKQIAFY